MTDDRHDSWTPSERRMGVRHFACFPAHVERPDGETRTAMIHDLSVSGALLLVHTRLKMGDEIRLALYISGNPEVSSRTVTGKVVRVEPLGERAAGLWSHRIAVHFDEKLDDLEGDIKALADKQKQLGLRP